MVFPCSRPHRPLSFLTAMSDEIVVAAVKSIQGNGKILIEVKEWLKGAGKSGVNKMVGEVFTVRKGRFSPCQTTVVKEGLSYLFFLARPVSGEKFYRSVDKYDGVQPPNAPAVRGIADTIKEDGQATKWKKSSKGVQIKLLSNKKIYQKKDEINLNLLIKNAGNKNLTLKYRTWPTIEHSYCDVKIVQGKEATDALAVPIKREEILKYFSKHGQKYDLVLTPGQVHHFPLNKINTAVPGWGYKEKLGFKYYRPKEGQHSVSLDCKNFFYFPLRTDSIEIELQAD